MFKYLVGGVIIFLLVIIGVIVFAGGNDKEPVVEVQKVSVGEFVDTDAVVRYIVDGPINATEEHETVRIAVDRTARSVDIMRGYQGEVVKSQLFPNNIDAFNTFVKALEQAEFSEARRRPTQTDSTGVCPTGRRYFYQIIENSQTKLDIWNTSCSSSLGTFTGNTSLVRDLFEAQIPDFDKIVSGTDLF
jgi:hypothetical protein